MPNRKVLCDKMSNIELKPCPFCGGEAYYRTPTHLKGTAFDVVAVECKQCGASPYAVEVYEFDTAENKRKAIADFWNRRVRFYSVGKEPITVSDNPELLKGGVENG